MPHGCMNVHVCVHKISLCAGVCVYMYLYVYIAHVCQCVCVCVRTCRYQSLRCHSSETVYFALETGSLINLNSLIFGSCWAPGIVLPLPPQFWDYKYHALLFHVGTGNSSPGGFHSPTESQHGLSNTTRHLTWTCIYLVRTGLEQFGACSPSFPSLFIRTRDL